MRKKQTKESGKLKGMSMAPVIAIIILILIIIAGFFYFSYTPISESATTPEVEHAVPTSGSVPNPNAPSGTELPNPNAPSPGSL